MGTLNTWSNLSNKIKLRVKDRPSNKQLYFIFVYVSRI